MITHFGMKFILKTESLKKYDSKKVGTVDNTTETFLHNSIKFPDKP